MGGAYIILTAVFILSLYGGMNYYIGGRIFQWFSIFIPHINSKIYACIWMLLALSLIVSMLPTYNKIKKIIKWIGWIGSYWMGIFAYLLILFIGSDLFILLGSKLKIIANPISTSIGFYQGLIVILIAISLACYGMYKANHIKHVSYDVKMKEKTLETGMKIVLISDLHLGAVNSEKHFPDIVENINNLKPDIVCITGDIFNNDYNAIDNPEKVMELFKSIKSKYGVYASLGNHDSGKTFNKMVSFLEESNVKLLKDEYVNIDDKLILIGRLDPSPIGWVGGLKRKDIKEILTSIDINMPIVVMDHTPSYIEQYGKEIDLVLSGHTHKGQIFPFNLVTKSIFTVDYGHYQKDANSPNFIVTSGANTWGMPMRVGSNSEIVSILFH